MLKKIIQHSILKNTLYTLSGKVAAMLLYMAFDIACARILAPEEYAEWVFFYAVLTMMFYTGWCGINSSTKVFVSKEPVRELLTKTIQASFLLRLIVSIVIGVILILIAFPLAKCLGYPNRYPSLYQLCLLAGLLVFLNSFTEFFKELFMGLSDFKKLCGITILEFAGYFLWSLLFLIMFKRVEAIAFGYVCGGTIVFVFGTACLRHISEAGILPRKADGHRSVMGKIFKYAIPIAISSIGGMVLVEMDTLMLGVLSSKVQVATYGIAKNLCSKATHVNYALTVGCMTSFSVLTMENIIEKRSKLLKMSGINVLISLVVTGAFLFFGSFMIILMYGREYRDAGRILKYLTPYYFMYSISTFFATFLDFQGKARIKSLCYCTVIGLNLFLNWLLIPRFGAVGAAIATSLSLVPYTILVVIITAEVIKSYSKYNPI